MSVAGAWYRFTLVDNANRGHSWEPTVFIGSAILVVTLIRLAKTFAIFTSCDRVTRIMALAFWSVAFVGRFVTKLV